MIPIVTPAEMRAVDADAPESISELIERAGRAVARAAIDMLGGTYGRTVMVIAGPGNNGRDGLVAAELLVRRGVRVTVVSPDDCPSEIRNVDLVIDAAYGTGFRGAWTPPATTAAVLAVDLPSGLDAMVGTVSGGALSAHRTVTFQALKPGHLVGSGPELSGRIEVADLGLDVSRARSGLVGADDVAAVWPQRPADAHKWRTAVRVVAGSPSMAGAGVLCANAAARAGASLVVASGIDVDLACRPEVMQRRLDGDWSSVVLADLDRFAALAVGPGLGRSEQTVRSVQHVVSQAEVPVVVDGDALFALTQHSGGLAAALEARTAPTVLTPHDGEFRALTGSLPDADRCDAVRRCAEVAGCTVLLKGPTTFVADPSGAVLAVDHGDQRLATAGSGDVLTGIIAALLALGVDPLKSAASAAWVHADAAHRCAPRGMLAGDIVERLPAALAGLPSF